MYFEVYRTWTGGDGNCFLSRPIILQGMQKCYARGMKILKMSCSEAVKSGEADDCFH